MRFSTSIVFAAIAAISQVAAQIQFESPPDTVTPNARTTLTWSGEDSAETITITLKKAGAVIATLLQRNGQATSFDWTPANTLASGDDYTLEISQGSDSSETPEFTVTAAATSGAATSSVEATATGSVTATSATSAVVTSLSTVEITTTTVAAPVTTIAPVGNITSSGSILPISTLTTLPANATTTGGSGSNSTGSASSTPTPTSTITPSNGAASLGSSVTLLVGAAAAIMFFC